MTGAVYQGDAMKIRTLFAAAALLVAQCAGVLADEKGEYNRRAAETDMAVFKELNRSGSGFLTREEVQGDMRLGTRFSDIDTNRDDIVTPQEMQRYLEQTYGVAPAPAPQALR
jgi:hypothetical protein